MQDTLHAYLREFQYDNLFDQEKFTKILSDLSYYGYKELFHDPGLLELIRSVA